MSFYSCECLRQVKYWLCVVNVEDEREKSININHLVLKFIVWFKIVVSPSPRLVVAFKVLRNELSLIISLYIADRPSSLLGPYCVCATLHISHLLWLMRNLFWEFFAALRPLYRHLFGAFLVFNELRVFFHVNDMPNNKLLAHHHGRERQRHTLNKQFIMMLEKKRII